MRTTAPSGLGSTPCLTAFSTSGCRISGGSLALKLASSRLHSTFQAIAETHLLDGQVVFGQLQLLQHRARPAGVGQGVAEQLAQVFQQALGLAGSARTSAMALLRVLNRKWGRMRACSSASCAVVPAGSRALKRQTSRHHEHECHQRTGRRAGQPGRRIDQTHPRHHGAAVQGHAAPRAMPTAHCAGSTRRSSGRLTAHITSSQPSVAGRAPVTSATNLSQPHALVAPNNAATATTSLHKHHRPQHHPDLAGVEHQIALAQRWHVGHGARAGGVRQLLEAR
jgi:hypothetical protein